MLDFRNKVTVVFVIEFSLQECLADLSYVNDLPALNRLVERLFRVVLPGLVRNIHNIAHDNILHV